MMATTPEPLSPSGSGPSPFRLDVEDQRRESVIESLGDKKGGSRPKRVYNILRRHRSSSPVDSQSSRRPTSLPPLNPDGTRPWARTAGRGWTPEDGIGGQPQSPRFIEIAIGFMSGGRRRRNSDSTPPSAFILGQDPISPLAGSLVIPRVTSTSIGTHVSGSPGNNQPRRQRIFFYHKHQPYYGFTNFSSHPVKYEGKTYPTSEHLFQSFKFIHRPKLAEHIRTCSFKPSVAFAEARRFALEIREDWSSDNIKAMEKVIYLKFTQHKELKRELLGTGNAELVENSDKDAFWGCGANGKGKNELGKALERLRDRLREEKRR